MIDSVVKGLSSGEVSFALENYTGSERDPGQILDGIFCDIGDALYEDPDTEIAMDQVQDMLSRLKNFRRCFRVRELMQPIAALEAYVGAAA